ncbi:hypothetical protein H0X32_03355 [Patescibacteria group bacterium]|nr:hypothetical protein [Patescibacteria group bacterium]
MAILDTPTHEVERGTIQAAGAVFTLEMIRSTKFNHLPFVVAKVLDPKDKILWTFRQESFFGVGVLAMAGDNPVIALTGSGRCGKVERVIPFSKLAGSQQIGLRETIRLKRAAADYLGRECHLSSTEEKIALADKARLRAEQEAAQAAAAEVRAAARELRVRTMLARGQITCFTADGQKRYGIPLLESEWPSCSNGVHVVVVDSIGAKGEIGTPIESFKVTKERGRNPSKGFAAFVTAERPKTAVSTAVAVRPIGSTFIEMDNAAFEVQLYGSMDKIREARTAGLNEGTYVAVKGVDASGKMLVYSVHTDKINTLGKFTPLST